MLTVRPYRASCARRATRRRSHAAMAALCTHSTLLCSAAYLVKSARAAENTTKRNNDQAGAQQQVLTQGTRGFTSHQPEMSMCRRTAISMIIGLHFLQMHRHSFQLALI